MLEDLAVLTQATNCKVPNVSAGLVCTMAKHVLPVCKVI